VSEEFKQYAAATQAMMERLNASLKQIEGAIRNMSEVETKNLNLAASAYDMSYLALRTIAELHVDFRAILLRLAQEPAANSAAQENRDLFIQALAEAQKSSGERPSLKPVGP
jgi:hypothetical protein